MRAEEAGEKTSWVDGLAGRVGVGIFAVGDAAAAAAAVDGEASNLARAAATGLVVVVVPEATGR